MDTSPRKPWKRSVHGAGSVPPTEISPQTGSELKELGKAVVTLAITIWTIGFSVLAIDWLPLGASNEIKVGMNLMWPVGFLGCILSLIGHFP
jgi:hypothetical protein